MLPFFPMVVGVFVIAPLSGLAAPRILNARMSTGSVVQDSTVYVRVRLPDGVSVEIPRGWTLASPDEKRHLYLEGKAIAEEVNLPFGPGGVYLRAYPPGGENEASVTISLLRGRAATQQAVAGLTGERLASVNRQYYDDLLSLTRAEGGKIVAFAGFQKSMLGHLHSLVSIYKYRVGDRPTMVIESHRIFLGGGSIGFMLQASEQSGNHWWPTMRRIRQSFVTQELQ